MAARKAGAVATCHRFNSADPSDAAELERLARELRGSTGEHISMQQPFRCDDGKSIHVGDGFLTNFNVTILDIAPVHIGTNTMIGPNVLITTVGHPPDRARRRAMIARAEPVTIGDDVWIGGNCTILPGVAIGDNVVIAAGAVVTKDVPSHCVVGGVPAKVLRELDPQD